MSFPAFIRLTVYVLALVGFLPGAPSRAVDLQQPAHIHVLVQDAAGHPLRGAVVTVRWRGWGESDQDLTQQTTDPSGVIDLAIPNPEGDQPQSLIWNVVLNVRKAGFAEHSENVLLFPHARMEKVLTLQSPGPNRSGTTLVRLRDPEGKPLPFIPLSLDYRLLDERASSTPPLRNPSSTDERGEYRFVHNPLWGALAVTVAGVRRLIGDAPIVVITLSREEMKDVPRSGTLRITVLTSDGNPAAGWFVSAHLRHPDWAYLMGTYDQSTLNVIDIEKLDARGSIRLLFAGENLLVISPVGIPFLYPLNPQSWPGGEKWLTLRLPPVRRIQVGRLLRDGKPAAGAPIVVYPKQSNGMYRGLTFGDEQHNALPLWQVKDSYGAVFHPLSSGEDGFYHLPVYFGSHLEYLAAKDGQYASSNLLKDQDVNEYKHHPLAPATWKDVTLRFVDEQGNFIPQMTTAGYSSSSVYTFGVSTNDSGEVDTQGDHLFLDPATDHLEISPDLPGWNGTEQTIAVPGKGDCTVTVTVGRITRLRPLTGVVLDPDGKPVAGVDIGLLSHKHNGKQYYLSYSAKTGVDGRFAFEAAPDECEINLYRAESLNGLGRLPGWTETPMASAAVRNLTIQLHRYGSVRVLLPLAAGTGPLSASLRGVDHPQHEADLDYDFPARSLRSTSIPPGRYHLTLVYSKTKGPLLNGVANILVDITAAAETVVDLRSRKILRGEAPAPPWLPLRVTSRGTPLSGVTVCLYTTTPAKGRFLPSWLQQPEGYYSSPYGPVQKVGADLTDDAGRVWYPAEPGRHYVAVARQPGQGIGWKAFTVTSGQAFSIEMQPPRTMQLTLHPARPVKRSGFVPTPEVRLRLDGVPGEEGWALLDSLDLLGQMHLWSAAYSDEPTTGAMNGESATVLVAEDLPPQLTYHVQLNRLGLGPLKEKVVHLQAKGPIVQDVQVDFPSDN